MTIFGTSLGPKTEIRRDLGGKKISKNKLLLTSTRVGDAFGYPFCAQISIPSSTERVKKKKNCWLVLEGDHFRGPAGAKNRNRRDLREEKISEKKNFFG